MGWTRAAQRGLRILLGSAQTLEDFAHLVMRADSCKWGLPQPGSRGPQEEGEREPERPLQKSAPWDLAGRPSPLELENPPWNLF